MKTPTINQSHQAQTVAMLHELSFPVHRCGYKQLTVAIPYFYQDDTQSLTKDLYPYVAQQYGHPDWHAVESSIRDVILDAWETRDPAAWDKYFPNLTKAPSNKLFIATLAEHLR